MKKHFFVGGVAAVLLLMVYLGIITLAEGFEHALSQTSELWYWVMALAIGFGVQAGLFSFIRQSNRRRVGTTAAVGASGGVSAGSMVACCAHHLSDVLPFLGLAGLATFLANYQTFFIVTGVLSNVVGITIMLDTIQHHGLSQRIAGWKWNMNLVKKGAIVSALFLLAFTFFLSFQAQSGS